MEGGDGFSDPRRRAARRSRGGARGRGRGQQQFRGSQKRNAARTKPKTDKDLGSNDYRFRVVEEDEEENAYDAGVDFEEASSQHLVDQTPDEDLEHAVELSDELAADFSKLESVLASVPLWVRLGEHARFALRVPEEESVEKYLDPLPPSENAADEPKKLEDQVTEEFLSDLANVSFDDDETTSEGLARSEKQKSAKGYEIKACEDKQGRPASIRGEEESVSSKLEEPDEFDKWLDEI